MQIRASQRRTSAQPSRPHKVLARHWALQRRLVTGGVLALIVSVLAWLFGATLPFHLGLTLIGFALGFFWRFTHVGRRAERWAFSWIEAPCGPVVPDRLRTHGRLGQARSGRIRRGGAGTGCAGREARDPFTTTVGAPAHRFSARLCRAAAPRFTYAALTFSPADRTATERSRRTFGVRDASTGYDNP